MSQQRGQTITDVELQYHDSKTNTDALVVTLLREYKNRLGQQVQQNQALTLEVQQLKDKYEPKEKKKKG